MLAGIFAFFKGLAIALGWLKEEREKQTGMDLQAGHDAEKALVVVKAEEAAVAAAPSTLGGVEDEMSKGTF
jgi:hypothetical protein